MLITFSNNRLLLYEKPMVTQSNYFLFTAKLKNESHCFKHHHYNCATAKWHRPTMCVVV